jgi:hypothetical protein
MVASTARGAIVVSLDANLVATDAISATPEANVVARDANAVLADAKSVAADAVSAMPDENVVARDAIAVSADVEESCPTTTCFGPV